MSARSALHSWQALCSRGRTHSTSYKELAQTRTAKNDGRQNVGSNVLGGISKSAGRGAQPPPFLNVRLSGCRVFQCLNDPRGEGLSCGPLARRSSRHRRHRADMPVARGAHPLLQVDIHPVQRLRCAAHVPKVKPRRLCYLLQLGEGPSRRLVKTRNDRIEHREITAKPCVLNHPFRIAPRREKRWSSAREHPRRTDGRTTSLPLRWPSRCPPGSRTRASSCSRVGTCSPSRRSGRTSSWTLTHFLHK